MGNKVQLKSNAEVHSCNCKEKGIIKKKPHASSLYLIVLVDFTFLNDERS